MIKSCNKTLNKSLDECSFDKKLFIQPIKLKSINQERLITRSLKLSKSFNLSLTDHKFEKQLNELESLRIPRNDSKASNLPLKTQNSASTYQVLDANQSFTQLKENSNLRSSRRLSMKPLFSFESSPAQTERVNIYINSESSLLKLETPKRSSSKQFNQSNLLNPSIQQISNPASRQSNECVSSSKENQFIYKVRSAARKLREMRGEINYFK